MNVVYLSLALGSMDDNEDRIVEKVQALSDVELAVLLCMVTEQHCIIETGSQGIDDLDLEIRLVSCRIHGHVSYF